MSLDDDRARLAQIRDDHLYDVDLGRWDDDEMWLLRMAEDGIAAQEEAERLRANLRVAAEDVVVHRARAEAKFLDWNALVDQQQQATRERDAAEKEAERLREQLRLVGSGFRAEVHAVQQAEDMSAAWEHATDAVLAQLRKTAAQRDAAREALAAVEALCDQIEAMPKQPPRRMGFGSNRAKARRLRWGHGHAAALSLAKQLRAVIAEHRDTP